jgi:hypothetical protein
MKFITDYKHLCDTCNMVIAEVAAVMPELPDTSDNEAPLMIASDRGMLCGGAGCRNGFCPGDKAKLGSYTVTLQEFEQHTGCWRVTGTLPGFTTVTGEEIPSETFEEWVKSNELKKE